MKRETGNGGLDFDPEGMASKGIANAGAVHGELLPSAIEMSWERCVGYGLNNDQASEFNK